MRIQKEYSRQTLTMDFGLILNIDTSKPGQSQEEALAVLALHFPGVEVALQHNMELERFTLIGGVSLTLENIQEHAWSEECGQDNTAVMIETRSNYHPTIEEAVASFQEIQQTRSLSRFYAALKYLTIPSEGRKELLEEYLKIVVKDTPLPEGESLHDEVGTTYRIDPLALAEVLAKPDASNEEELVDPQYFSPWNDLFPRVFGSYSSAMDDVFIDALKVTRGGEGQPHDRRNIFRAKHGDAGELALYILAGHGFTEYGTSPRTAWPDPTVADQWDLLITKWENYCKANFTKVDGTPAE